MTEYGYAGRILWVDLSSGKVTTSPTSEYAERFVGGRGVAAGIYWDKATPGMKASDPENPLIFVSGPTAGFTGIAGSRWQVCGKAAADEPDYFSWCNLGGTWGLHLKYAGYDGLVVTGKAEKPVYLLIQDDKVEIRSAAHLWGKTTFQTRDTLKEELGNTVRVVSTGPAGENLVAFATMLADEDASGSGGLGAVMGHKKLKAVAIRGTGKPTAAHPERLREISIQIKELVKGTPHWIPETMTVQPAKRQACWGCSFGCDRKTYQASDGVKGKFFCQAGLFYIPRAEKFYGEHNEVPFWATKVCDEYGLNISAIEVMIFWLSRCHKAGVLTDENTGIPLSRMGSREFMDTLVKKTALREGFGDILARGTLRAAQAVGKAGVDQIGEFLFKQGEKAPYEPRRIPTNAIIYAVEPRMPIMQLHEIMDPLYKWLLWYIKNPTGFLSTESFHAIAKRFWGGEVAGDLSTYEGKALAAKMIQDRQYSKESMILCDLAWPVIAVKSTPDHVGDPSLESKVYSAVTGKETSEQEWYRIGEVTFNMQRAIHAREGHRGREADKLPEKWHTVPLKPSSWDPASWENPDSLVPGPKGVVAVSRNGAVVERDKFEKMKDEYYQLRG
ncbi:MAG: aldehyde ferredoxin oxidoreductase N-terminal domain-containing protein, partial [Dehalococcoidia bacterium]|nr:aldehyde ferredoxin oxidoreductase N-terminal domain-containing protein [Dehalococcoidia bacterium]